MPTALIVLADGFEEMEAVAPIDLLRRAEVEVTVAGLDGTELTGRNGIAMAADCTLSEVAEKRFDLVVVPGGPAFKQLRADTRLLQLLKTHEREERLVAAICAAPTVLADAGLLEGRAYTAHFSVHDELTEARKREAVVVDQRVITSQGAGTATPFALALVEALVGQEEAWEIADSICWQS